MSIHIAAALSVNASSATIIMVHTKTPSIGTSGTNGVLNGRLISGLLLRIINMPALTSTKANKVPKEVKSPAILPGTNAANAPTKTNNIQLALNGVWNLGCSSPKAGEANHLYSWSKTHDFVP
jgi:hypothetical protein